MEANNNKAMRDALVDLKSEAETTLEYRDYPIAGDPSDRGYCKVVDADYIIGKCDEALAKPPRVCDVMSAEECKRIFAKEITINLPPEATDNDRTIATLTANGVIDTLYATAQAGGYDGSK